MEFLLNFTSSKGIIVDEIIEDIGSGLKYNRKKWNKPYMFLVVEFTD